MASSFFGLLAAGASFAGRKDVAEFKKKQKKAKLGGSTRSPVVFLNAVHADLQCVCVIRVAAPTISAAGDADELDFFGFNAPPYATDLYSMHSTRAD